MLINLDHFLELPDTKIRNQCPKKHYFKAPLGQKDWDKLQNWLLEGFPRPDPWVMPPRMEKFAEKLCLAHELDENSGIDRNCEDSNTYKAWRDQFIEAFSYQPSPSEIIMMDCTHTTNTLHEHFRV